MPFRSAILQKSGRACGGKHGAGVCNIKRAVMAASSIPAAPKPSANLVPAALCDKAQFTRKRAAAAPAGEATDDEVADVMRAAVKKARGSQLPRQPRRPSLWQSPRRPQRQCPRPRPRRQSKWHRASLRSKPCRRRDVKSKPEIVLTHGCRIWHCSSPHLHLDVKASFSWQGSRCGRQRTSSRRRRCRSAAFRMGLRAGGGDPSGCSVDDLCSSLQPRAL